MRPFTGCLVGGPMSSRPWNKPYQANIWSSYISFVSAFWASQISGSHIIWPCLDCARCWWCILWTWTTAIFGLLCFHFVTHQLFGDPAFLLFLASNTQFSLPSRTGLRSRNGIMPWLSSAIGWVFYFAPNSNTNPSILKTHCIRKMKSKWLKLELPSVALTSPSTHRKACPTMMEIWAKANPAIAVGEIIFPNFPRNYKWNMMKAILKVTCLYRIR